MVVVYDLSTREGGCFAFRGNIRASKFGSTRLFFSRNLSSVRASSACTGGGQEEKAAAAGLFVKERGDGGIY